MARRSFFSRITRAVRNIFAPSPPPPRPARPPAPTGPSAPVRRDFRAIWRSEHPKHSKANFEKHLRLFHSAIDPIEQDPNEQLDLWQSYVHNIVNDEGRFRRNSTQNMFWRDSGIDPADLDWSAWREAMGYGRTALQ
jgi:hypothetical protein